MVYKNKRGRHRQVRCKNLRVYFKQREETKKKNTAIKKKSDFVKILLPAIFPKPPNLWLV